MGRYLSKNSKLSMKICNSDVDQNIPTIFLIFSYFFLIFKNNKNTKNSFGIDTFVLEQVFDRLIEM